MIRRRGDWTRNGSGLTARGSPARRRLRRVVSSFMATLFLLTGSDEAIGAQDCAIHHLSPSLAHGTANHSGPAADDAVKAGHHIHGPAHTEHGDQTGGEEAPDDELCGNICACIGGCHAGADILPFDIAARDAALAPIPAAATNLLPTTAPAGRPPFFFPFALAPPNSR
jgi:hypothetical protein